MTKLRNPFLIDVSSEQGCTKPYILLGRLVIGSSRFVTLKNKIFFDWTSSQNFLLVVSLKHLGAPNEIQHISCEK